MSQSPPEWEAACGESEQEAQARHDREDELLLYIGELESTCRIALECSLLYGTKLVQDEIKRVLAKGREIER